jgi:hypothetical protein
MSQFLNMFNSAGPEAFSQMACQVAPYFSTINPQIAELRPGHAVVNVPFRKCMPSPCATPPSWPVGR